MTGKSETSSARRITRRHILVGAGAGGVTLAAPFVWRRPANAAGQVIVRTPGGVYEDIMRKAVYDPFTKETGIQVVPVASTVAKLIAMFKAGNVELDVIDTGDGTLLTLEKMGALAPIPYDKWKWGKPEDIMPELRRKHQVGNFVYATVLSYNKQSFPDGKHPKSWKEFWDTQKFPGPRMLADQASGSANLEFALLADGVPLDKIYPVDVDRALKSLSRLRPSIRKFWDTGALSAQMLSDKEVVLGSIWSGRAQAAIDKGAPLAIEWAENMIQVQAYGIFKDAKNFENGLRFIDFAAQPERQAIYGEALRYGPANNKAYALIPKDVVDNLPGGPKYRDNAFYQNIEWWDTNRETFSKAWNKWLLG